jgi:hypothetical protein
MTIQSMGRKLRKMTGSGVVVIVVAEIWPVVARPLARCEDGWREEHGALEKRLTLSEAANHNWLVAAREDLPVLGN